MSRLSTLWHNLTLPLWCWWWNWRRQSYYCHGQAIQHKLTGHCAVLVQFLRRYIVRDQASGRGAVVEVWLVHSPRGWQYASIGKNWRLL